MVLFEMLDSYITNPVNEIRKIEDILNRKRHIQYDGTYSLKEVFGIAYTRTQFASLEPTINSFLTNIIYKDYSETDYVKTAICYRCLCEFLLAIIDHGIEYYYLCSSCLFGGDTRVGGATTLCKGKAHLVWCCQD